MYNGQSTSNEGHAFAEKTIGQYESLPLVPGDYTIWQIRWKGSFINSLLKKCLSLAIMPNVFFH